VSEPRIAIVGAGLAGLTCAYRLHQAGVASQVFEARDRVGGRCWSATDLVDGQAAEHGGEFIDTFHEHLLRVIAELGLELEDRAAAGTAAGASSRFVLHGRELRAEELLRDEFVARVKTDAERIGDLTFDRASDEARAFDEMSLIDWLDANVDGGSGSTLGRVVALGVSLNLGMPPGEIGASALLEASSIEDWEAMSSRLGDDHPPSMADVVDAVTLVFHVRGGNDLVPRALADALPDGELHLETPLEALRLHADGTYRLRLRGRAAEFIADKVVLALPFTTLRHVDLDDSGLSPRKRGCIDRLPMGSNTKLLLAFDRPLSALAPGTASITIGPPNLIVWDTSLGQQGPGGIATVFTAGKVFEADAAHGAAAPDAVEQALALLEASAPGSRSAFTGNAWLDSWPDDPWSHGSYAGWGPGDATRYWGLVGLPEGGVHFAGEHTSTVSPGFLDGAVESGERAAREVLESVVG
jgi:monoamine oxidase